jgi:hypothetical protein
MALPVSITGLVVTVPVAGPYKASNGYWYAIGVSSADGTKLRCLKATDPTDSWSAVGTDPTIDSAVSINGVDAWQDGDTLHVATASVNSTPTWDYRYRTFDMSSDAWSSINEAIETGVTPATDSTNRSSISICKRSQTGEIFALYTRCYLYMSVYYQNPWYKRRTGVNTWTTALVALPAGEDSIRYNSYRTLPDPLNDRVNFIYVRNTNSHHSNVFTAANGLSSAGSASNDDIAFSTAHRRSITQWNDGGTIRIVVGRQFQAAGSLSQGYWASSDSPTRTWPSAWASDGYFPIRVFSDVGEAGTSTVWMIYRSGGDGHICARKSTDDGATFGNEIDIMTASVALDAAMSIGPDRTGVVQRGSAAVIPFFVDDNGTLRYNEYTVRSTLNELAATGLTVAAPSIGVPALARKINLVADNLAVTAPALGTPTFTEKYNYQLQTAGLVAGAPFIGTPLLTRNAFLTLGSHPLDFGLSSFGDANKILVCSDILEDYADALAKEVGEYNFGAGNAFGAPEAGTPTGRKVTSAVVSSGVTVTPGNVVCWAAVDTANSRLLAFGPLVDGSPLAAGQGWGLDAFSIHFTAG